MSVFFYQPALHYAETPVQRQGLSVFLPPDALITTGWQVNKSDGSVFFT